MFHLSKRFLFLAGTLVAVIVLVLAGLDLYAGSSAVHERLETALGKKLRVPVKVESFQYTLWSGLVARNVVIAGDTASSLAVPRIAARIAWLPLFSHRLQIKQLVLSDPALDVVQDSEGKWVLPLGQRKQPVQPPVPQEGTAPVPPTPSQPAPSAPEPSAAPLKPPGKSTRVNFLVRKARVENATLRFVDPEGKAAGVIEGINIECPRGLKSDMEGRISIRKASLRDGWTLEAIKTPFVIKAGALTLPDLEAILGGGTVRGKMTAAALNKEAPYTLSLLFDGVEIRNLQAQIQGERDGCKTAGTIQGSLDIYGLLGRKKSIAGTGQLRIHNGRMAQVPLLQTIGKTLGIEELTCLELQQAQLDLRAAEGKVYVDSLVMESPNLSLTANGTSTFSGKLNLDARLLASSKVTRQLPQSIEANFQTVPGSPRKAISFHINGTVNHPQTDLMRVLVGQKIENELINVFKVLTGKPKKKAGVLPEASPSPEPVESPAP